MSDGAERTLPHGLGHLGPDEPITTPRLHPSRSGAVLRRRSAEVLKRSFDIVGAGLGLLLFAPLLLFLVVRIRRDSEGPALFRQWRIGRDGVAFRVWKFRTMRLGADLERPELRSEYQLEGQLLKLENDPRLTRVGRPLRRSSLDELPQLWNVLRGDMSLVGPRPLPLDEADQTKQSLALRQTVKPGMTGPWQTSGRSTIPFEGMLELDAEYASSWTIAGDLRLLVATLPVVLRGDGAY